jgi:hypothetical protein
MKPKIISTSIAVLLLLGFSATSHAAVSDWFGGIMGGLDCAGKIANCTSSMSVCKRKVEEEGQRCSDKYNKAMTRCQYYQNQATNYLSGCQDQLSQCQIKAQRYNNDAAKYSSYMAKCQERNNTCQNKAEKKKASYLEKASSCRQKAGDNENKCEARYIERQAKKIENCTNRARACLKKLMNKCGPLVPSL